MPLQRLDFRDNFMSERAATMLNEVLIRARLSHLDIRGNQIVLRFLDNILVTAGFKSSLEYLGIEDNIKAYEPRRAVCSCIMIKTQESAPDLAYTKVTPLQLQNRN